MATRINEIYDWFVDNKRPFIDDAMNRASNGFKSFEDNGKIDRVDLDFIVEDIVDSIQEGVLNVLETFMK